MDQRGRILFAGRHFAAPGARAAPRAFRLVASLGDRVADIPARAPEGHAVVFLLGYEASVAFDARLPTKPPDPTLGPQLGVWLVEPCEIPQRADGRPPSFTMPDDTARQRHLARVLAAKERILDGVVYQANLAHRIEVVPATFDDGLAFFQRKTARDPPACAAFFDLPGFGSLVSLSPERFVHADLEAGAAASFPIKGTAPRGAHAALLASEKDRAEHVMIVDLLRNDLGRVAQTGSVTVERLLELVELPHVLHLESTITARLRPDVTVQELLRATAPGGSITGAPKSSAIETIFALEDGARGPYTGVLGLLEGSRLRSSLLIRTWIRPDDGPGALHVGGGIVADSDPASEWQETLDKAAAFVRA